VTVCFRFSMSFVEIVVFGVCVLVLFGFWVDTEVSALLVVGEVRSMVLVVAGVDVVAGMFRNSEGLYEYGIGCGLWCLGSLA